MGKLTNQVAVVTGASKVSVPELPSRLPLRALP